MLLWDAINIKPNGMSYFILQTCSFGWRWLLKRRLPSTGVCSDHVTRPGSYSMLTPHRRLRDGCHTDTAFV